MVVTHVAVRLAALLLPASLFAMPAAAQDGNSKRAPIATPGAAGSRVPPAPVGHRQPTAADVPSEAADAAAEKARAERDRALDAKLQICRGC